MSNTSKSMRYWVRLYFVVPAWVWNAARCDYSATKGKRTAQLPVAPEPNNVNASDCVKRLCVSWRHCQFIRTYRLSFLRHWLKSCFGCTDMKQMFYLKKQQKKNIKKCVFPHRTTENSVADMAGTSVKVKGQGSFIVNTTEAENCISQWPTLLW